jgi:hypothetical protein
MLLSRRSLMKRLLLLLPLLSFTALKWQPFAIDQHVTVYLPVKPIKAQAVPGKQVGRNRTWMLPAPEGMYQIMRMPTGLAQMDDVARNAYYERLLTFTMRQEHGQLELLTVFPTDAGPSLEYKYRVVRPGTHQHVTKIVRTLVVDSVAYSLNFTATDPQDSLGLTGAAQRVLFYNSLTIRH